MIQFFVEWVLAYLVERWLELMIEGQDICYLQYISFNQNVRKSNNLKETGDKLNLFKPDCLQMQSCVDAIQFLYIGEDCNSSAMGHRLLRHRFKNECHSHEKLISLFWTNYKQTKHA